MDVKLDKQKSWWESSCTAKREFSLSSNHTWEARTNKYKLNYFPWPYIQPRAGSTDDAWMMMLRSSPERLGKDPILYPHYQTLPGEEKPKIHMEISGQTKAAPETCASQNSPAVCCSHSWEDTRGAVPVWMCSSASESWGTQQAKSAQCTAPGKAEEDGGGSV